MPTFFITGASQGIGAEVARQFSREPEARVILVARNEANLRKVAEGCSDYATVAVEPCDVTDEAAVSRLSEAVLGRFGVPDVVVNNAGVFRPGGIRDTTVADFRDQTEVNLTSAFIVTKSFLGGMLERGSGMFIQMASVAAIRGYPAGAAYCASKHGLLGLSRALRAETQGSGIRVTTVLAGATWTPSWEGAGHSEERMMPVADIAALVVAAWRLGDRSVVEEILVRPQLGDI